MVDVRKRQSQSPEVARRFESMSGVNVVDHRLSTTLHVQYTRPMVLDVGLQHNPNVFLLQYLWCLGDSSKRLEITPAQASPK